MRITVLHLLGPLRPSGMERMLLTAQTEFAEKGIRNIIVGQGQSHSFVDELSGVGYPVYTLSPIGESWRATLQLRNVVRKHHVDLIHIHTEGNYLRTAAAARYAIGRRKALIRTVHSIFDAQGTWYLKRRFQALVADRFMASVVAPSADVAANERRFGRDPQVIMNWVDARFADLRARDSLQSHDRLTAVIVGNCGPVKQHRLALRALLASDHLVCHIGDEQFADREEQDLLRRLEEDGRLIMRGAQPPDEALRSGDYFVFPSSHEGMGVALAEALTAGLPALVNDVPGLQWARHFPQAIFVRNTEIDWENAIHTLHAPIVARSVPQAPSVDFSAIRGVNEYGMVYRRIIERSAQ